MARGILIYGYGNPGRQDDGLGPALVSLLEKNPIPGIETDCNYQLQVEDALTIMDYDAVVFVDASLEGEGPYAWNEIHPSFEISFTSHDMTPAAVLALCRDLYGKTVPAWLLAIRGYGWDFVEGLTPEAARNLDEACRFLRDEIPHMARMDSQVMH